MNCIVLALSDVELCQDESETYRCDVIPNTTMHIVYANYGRLSLNICVPADGINYPYNVTDCQAANSTEILQAKCDGEVDCQFLATNGEFGYDPCRNVSKYLQVTYECIQSGRYHIFKK